MCQARPAMLRNEAAWLRAELARLSKDTLDPMLSIGSGSEFARKILQPYIEEFIFTPLESRGVRVLHHEHRPGRGIDVSGDLGDPAVIAFLTGLGVRSVLCCNVLEHLSDRAGMAKALAALVGPDGQLLITVPRRFPYHPDPIDTMYRPSVEELAREFPTLQLEQGAEVRCGALVRYLRDTGSLGRSLRNGLRAMRARDRDTSVAVTERSSIGALLPYIFRSTSVTCVSLAHPAAGA